jgi:hypothetical protein
LGLIKHLFISILKLAKDQITMATNHLVGSAITLHNIPKDWLLEFFGGVAADSRSSIAGAVTLAIGNSEFS